MMVPARDRWWTDDTGSLPLAMLLTLVGVSLSALLVPTLLTQVDSTRYADERTHSLHAAQAGLDIALGHIRAASDAAGAGKLASLPCGPYTGRVGAGTARYKVTITYYDADPYSTSAHVVTCRRSTPAYALLRSKGIDDLTSNIDTATGRVLQGTYTVQTTNQNIAGGLIRVYRASSSTVDLCLDAGSSSPAASTAVQMQTCVSGSSQQKFAYHNNLNLVLVASKTPAMPLGMCLEATTPQASGTVVRFQPCTTSTVPRQQWSFNNNQGFQGTDDGEELSDYCFNVQTPGTVGSFVVLGKGGGKCGGGGDNNVKTFWPEASVGAGAAGENADQLVNFAQFGRCLDVTQHKVDWGYLIAWPCKQAPDPDDVSWNQRWALPVIASGATSATGKIVVTDSDDVDYCLRNPGSSGAGMYVDLVACPAGAPPNNLKWTRYENTGTYMTSYRIEAGDGTTPLGSKLCLAPADQNVTPTDFHDKGDRVSKIFVMPCTGSTLQKWNADPNILQSLPLKDLNEK